MPCFEICAAEFSCLISREGDFVPSAGKGGDAFDKNVECVDFVLNHRTEEGAAFGKVLDDTNRYRIGRL